MNSQKYNKKELYPEEFDEDDKLKFDYYLEQSKLMFPKMGNDEWLLKTGIKAFMLKEKRGIDEPATEDEIAEIKKKYSDDGVYYYSEPELKPEAVEVKE
jgi:hypothetical protein